MPKQVFIPRQLPPKKPDRCELCPLIGLIPKEDRERGKREKYYCLGIYEPLVDEEGNPILDDKGCQRFGFPRLSTREANNVSASQRKEKGHLLHRPCDNMWAAWMRLQGRKFPMLTNYAVSIPPGGRTDAFVQTIITWEHEGKTFKTRGLDADQTEAAIKATIKMLNIIE